MNVTREVIYDLLPAYFAGEASADTRALVDEFMRTDPEFKQMADRFRRLLERRDTSALRAEPAAERVRFEATKQVAKWRQIAVIWATIALFFFVFAAVTGLGRFGYVNPGLINGVVFTVCAIGAWFASRRARRGLTS